MRRRSSNGRLLAATRRCATVLRVKKVISGVPIDHSKVIDGFGEVSGKTEYADERVRCGLCGTKFVFTAAAKKYVFEVRGVPVKMRHRGAAYCDPCRDRRAALNRLLRAIERLQREHRRAVAAARAAPDDAGAHAACARSIVRLVASSGKGPLNSAIHHARRARKLDPTCVESLYWEGRAHELALRPRQARAMFEAFLADDSGRALAPRRTDARRRLASPGGVIAPDPNVPDVRLLPELKRELELARSEVVLRTLADVR